MNEKRERPIASLDEIMTKPYKFVSSMETLGDVEPPGWSDDILNGERKITVDIAKPRQDS